jgi:serine/threonine-protein kinase SRPK3
MEGKLINKKYILIKEIGSGMFSSIWLCIDYKNSKYYAMKIINNNDLETGKNEIEILKKIKKHNCKNTLTFVEHFMFDNTLYIVQNLMACSLDKLIKYQYQDGLPENIIIKVYNDIKNALIDLHKLNIMHGDIKPENIFINGYSIKINNIINNLKNIKTKNKLLLTNYIKNNLNKKNNKNKEDICDYECSSCSEFDINEDEINTESDIISEHEDDDDINEELNNFVDNLNDKNIDNKNEILKKCKNIINDVQLNNSNFYLGDFGNSIDLNNYDKNCKYSDFQTRYYRAPEIILRCPKTLKSDYWALGCTIYELFTNQILFNPYKSKGISCDKQHLLNIIQFNNIINNNNNNIINDKLNRKFDIFFIDNNFKYNLPIDKIIISKKITDNKEIYSIIKILINIDFNKRIF